MADLSTLTPSANPTEDIRGLRVELDAANQKLRQCSDTIISQANELTMLRKIICRNCKRKFLDAAFNSSSSPAPPSLHGATPRAANQASIPAFPAPFDSRRQVANSQSSPRISTTKISTSSNGAAPQHRGPPGQSERVETPVTTSNASAHPGNLEHNSEFPWSVGYRLKVNKILDVTFERAFAYKGHVNCVKFSMNGKYVAIGLSGGESRDLNHILFNGEVIVYSTESGEQICRLAEHSEERKSGVYTMCFSPDDRLLAIGHVDGHINLWLIAKKRVQNMFRHPHRGVFDLDFSPNGQKIGSASGNDTVIWRVRDGSSNVLNDKGIMNGHWYRRFKFSPNGSHVAAAHGDGFLRIWDSRTHQLVVKWHGHNNVVSSLAFMPDGMGLLSGSFDDSINYWQVAALGDLQLPPTMQDTVTLFHEFEGHTNRVSSIAIAADGQWLLSGSNDGTARLWNTSNGTEQCSLHGHSGWVLSVDISRVGNYLAIGDAKGQVSLWRYKVI